MALICYGELLRKKIGGCEYLSPGPPPGGAAALVLGLFVFFPAFSLKTF